MTITYVSLFAGAGGWDLGNDAAGWECVAQVENDPTCLGVLARHWPDVPRWGDVAEVNGADLPPAHVVCFGSPCTDLSIAGQRAGLHGDESGLFFEAVRIIKEMRDATNGTLPIVGLWENVRGALSSNEGADFGVALDSLADVGAMAIEWRVIDGLSWLPQRRTRVFVAARFALGADGPAEVFTDAEGGEGDPRSDGASWKDNAIAALTSSGAGSGAGPDSAHALAGHLVPTHTGSIATTFGSKNYSNFQEVVSGSVIPYSIAENQRNEIRTSETMHQLSPTAGKAGQGRPIIAFHTKQDPISGEGFTPAISMGDGSASIGVADELGVRRLMPIECERLQGWPEHHTRWLADGTEVGDPKRYRMLGNGVMAPMGEWVARRVTRAIEVEE